MKNKIKDPNVVMLGLSVSNTGLLVIHHEDSHGRIDSKLSRETSVKMAKLVLERQTKPKRAKK